MTRKLSLWIAVLIIPTLSGADWPQHRHDAGRGAASLETLAKQLHPLWTREFPVPRPAFPSDNRLCYDLSYEPVVMGRTMFVPSMVEDCITALDTATGDVRWRFFAEGPIRFAPVAWRANVYFVSDDGYLYCVAQADGSLVWKFRGLPEGRKDRKLMGDGRLISAFPARGGPVLADGIVYFGAGVWADEGVFVHAVDAESGRAVWSNTDSDRIEQANPDHGVGAVAGIAPQGHLAVVGDRLVVPCGAQLPAMFDRKTGRRYAYTMGWGGKDRMPKGCAFVCAIGSYLFHGGDLYDLNQPEWTGELDPLRSLHIAGLCRIQVDRTNGKKVLGEFRRPVLTPEAMYYYEDGVVAFDLTRPERMNVAQKSSRQRNPDTHSVVFPELWRLAADTAIHIKVGDRLYGSRKGRVVAIDIPKPGQRPAISGQIDFDGTAYRMLAADGKLFVVTLEGSIHAFGPERAERPRVHASPTAPTMPQDVWHKRAVELLEAHPVDNGLILFVDPKQPRLAEELVRQSDCELIALVPDAERATALRERFQQVGLYGTKISVVVGTPDSVDLPPYLAGLILVDKDVDEKQVATLCRWLRPYGGSLVRTDNSRTLFSRDGPLPEAADWSHREANPANTASSLDRHVGGKLKRLWFDGSLRWQKKRPETEVRIAGGRMFIVDDVLRAFDAYTGRVLWQRPAASGARNLVALPDALYLPGGSVCAVLDPATGEKVAQIDFPGDTKGRWSMLRVTEDALVGAGDREVACCDRKTHETHWTTACRNRIASVAVGRRCVFYCDAVNRRRGKAKPTESAGMTFARDFETGELLWRIDATGALRYCRSLDLLVVGDGVYRAKDGQPVWRVPEFEQRPLESADGRLVVKPNRLPGNVLPTQQTFIVGTRLITYRTQNIPKHAIVTLYDLATGRRIDELQWWQRGCTVLRAGETMLTTRYQGAASYYDLASGRMTRMANVRAGCSNNLFPADGLLCSPNLTLGCACNYMPVGQAFAPVADFE